MKRGDSTFTVIFFIAALVGAGILALGYGPSWKRQSDMKQEMEDIMLRYSALGEEQMLASLEKHAERLKITLKPDSLKFEGDVGEMSTLTLEYDDVLDFLFTRKLRHVKIEIKAKIPDRYAA